MRFSLHLVPSKSTEIILQWQIFLIDCFVKKLTTLSGVFVAKYTKYKKSKGQHFRQKYVRFSDNIGLRKYTGLSDLQYIGICQTNSMKLPIFDGSRTKQKVSDKKNYQTSSIRLSKFCTCIYIKYIYIKYWLLPVTCLSSYYSKNKLISCLAFLILYLLNFLRVQEILG